jgi:hypothetical protein
MTLETSVEFAENPEPRCACVLLLDKSGSMGGAPIAALNEGLRTFKDTLAKDPVASKRVEIAVVTFDSNVRLLQDSVTIEQFDPPVISDLGGATLMSAGINLALELVHNRKAQYRSSGVTYYQPNPDRAVLRSRFARILRGNTLVVVHFDVTAENRRAGTNVSFPKQSPLRILSVNKSAGSGILVQARY